MENIPIFNPNQPRPNKEAPCREKGCSHCCDPVKIESRAAMNNDPQEAIKDKMGRKIWTRREGEILVPDHDPETKLFTYDCMHYNKETGKCMDYENRPDICRGTSCIDPKSDKSADEQHREFTSGEFIEIKGRKY